MFSAYLSHDDSDDEDDADDNEDGDYDDDDDDDHDDDDDFRICLHMFHACFPHIFPKFETPICSAYVPEIPHICVSAYFGAFDVAIVGAF
jgi:hypothetical protein